MSSLRSDQPKSPEETAGNTPDKDTIAIITPDANAKVDNSVNEIPSGSIWKNWE